VQLTSFQQSDFEEHPKREVERAVPDKRNRVDPHCIDDLHNINNFKCQYHEKYFQKHQKKRIEVDTWDNLFQIS
jgi:hypothetical protein